jgi:hypothetical protein
MYTWRDWNWLSQYSDSTAELCDIVCRWLGGVDFCLGTDRRVNRWPNESLVTKLTSFYALDPKRENKNRECLMSLFIQ